LHLTLAVPDFDFFSKDVFSFFIKFVGIFLNNS